MSAATWDDLEVGWDSLLFGWDSYDVTVNPPLPPTVEPETRTGFPGVPEMVEVSVWEADGDEYQMVGGIAYDRLDFGPRHLDVGPWSMTVTEGPQSAKLTPARLVTTLYRGTLLTWVVNPVTDQSAEDTTGATRTVAGFDALSMLGWETAWPNPTLRIGNQDPQGRVPLAEPEGPGGKAPAETVIRTLIADNFRDRAGFPLVCPPSQGRGSDVVARPEFDNLQELVLRKAKAGGIGVRLGLVNTTSSTRAALTLSFYVPRDRTTRVHLTAADGSLESWSLTRNAPTCTQAIVVGAKNADETAAYVKVVTTPESIADAANWGGHRSLLVEGPETFDDEPLIDAGEDALREGAAVTALDMAASEPVGTLAFRDFAVGDRVIAVPVAGVEIADVLTSITVTHDDGPITVTPTFGDPDADLPGVQEAQIVRGLRREVQRMKTRNRASKRNDVDLTP